MMRGTPRLGLAFEKHGALSFCPQPLSTSLLPRPEPLLARGFFSLDDVLVSF
jgi:hypothetical protein